MQCFVFEKSGELNQCFVFEKSGELALDQCFVASYVDRNLNMHAWLSFMKINSSTGVDATSYNPNRDHDVAEHMCALARLRMRISSTIAATRTWPRWTEKIFISGTPPGDPKLTAVHILGYSYRAEKNTSRFYQML